MRVGRRVKGLRHVLTVFVEVASEQRPERTITNTSPTQGVVSNKRPSPPLTLRSDETEGSDAEEIAPPARIDLSRCEPKRCFRHYVCDEARLGVVMANMA